MLSHLTEAAKPAKVQRRHPVIKRTAARSAEYRTIFFYPKIAAVGAVLILLSWLSLAGPSTKGARTNQSAQSKPLGTLVGVVSGEGAPQMSMDAVVLVEHGTFKAPYKEDDETDRQRFANEYFQSGLKYRLTFGGGEVGMVTIKKWDQGCNNIHAELAVTTTANIHGQIMALATNSETFGRKASARRAPTEGERAAVMDLVKQIYRVRGATPALMQRLQTTNLTATDIDGDGKYEIIGSFVIQTAAKARRDLFLIAEPQAEGYKATLVEYQSYKLSPDGFDSEIKLVDQLDLDGDGIGEVFAIQSGVDAYGYSIYKKQNGGWRKVYSATGDAC